MKELVRSAFQWLADTRLARRVVDTLFRSKARRRIVELDRQSLARCQSRTDTVMSPAATLSRSSGLNITDRS